MSGIRSQEAVGRSKSDVATFEDFEVFQRAYRISLDVHRASLAFPAVEQYGLADQIRRASKSICGNIAEGFGKRRRSTRRIQALSSDGDWIGGRDAGLAAILLGPGIHRSEGVCDVAG